MSIRLDQVDFSTLHESYKNYDTKTDALTLSADILPNGFTQNYPVNGGGVFTPISIPYDRAGTRADIYLDGKGFRVLANTGSRASGDVYQYKSSETFSTFVTYSASAITVWFSIFNGSGGSITLIPQTITVSAVLDDAPITATT